MCPHGNGPPEFCSQCLGIMVVRSPLRTASELIASFGTIALTKTRKRCTHCRKAGHVVSECRELARKSNARKSTALEEQGKDLKDAS